MAIKNATIVAHVTAKTVRQMVKRPGRFLQVEFSDDTARIGAVFFEDARSKLKTLDLLSQQLTLNQVSYLIL